MNSETDGRSDRTDGHTEQDDENRPLSEEFCRDRQIDQRHQTLDLIESKSVGPEPDRDR